MPGPTASNTSSAFCPCDIVGLGTVVVDLQFTLDAYPAPDTKVEARQARVQIGGPVPTALALLARFGHRCTFLGCWGDDPHGRAVEENFDREGITWDPQQSRFAGLQTGTAHVWVDAATGQRTIACHRAEPPGGELPFDAAGLPAGCALHLDGWPGATAVRAARAVRDAGGPVFYDTGSPKDRTAELLELATVVNCPRQFIRKFLGTDDVATAGPKLLARGPKWVTITDGERGAWLFDSDGVRHQPAYPVTAIDTTGAGDVFSGGLIHAALQDWPAERALAFASACAALKCRGLGNRDALPTVADVEQLIGQTPA